MLLQTDLSHRLNAASSVGAILIWPWFLFLFRISLCSTIVIAGASVSIFAFSHAARSGGFGSCRVRGLLGELLIFIAKYLWSLDCSLLAIFMPLGPKLIASPTELGSSAHFYLILVCIVCLFGRLQSSISKIDQFSAMDLTQHGHFTIKKLR